MTISVLIADDQPLFCSGIGLLLDAQEDLTYVGAAHSGTSAIEESRTLRPDVVLMDLRMPDGNGITATRAIRGEQPTVRVLVLTTFRDQHAVERALDAGAAGFITKDASPTELLTAIRDTAHGRPVRRPTSLPRAPMLPDPLYAAVPNTDAITALSAREQEIFLHVARGLSNGQIAELAQISENTVRNHVSSVLAKLHLSNRAQVAGFAHREGLVHGALRHRGAR